MADPVTNNYSLVLPTVGGDLNIWGGQLNNGTIQAADAALGASFPISITSADVALTAAQFANAIFICTGTLTGNRNLFVPLSPNSATVACGGRFVVVNNTNGLFTLNVMTVAVGSIGVTVPQGFAAFLYSDGTNIQYCDNGLPGYALASAGNPNGFFAGTAGSPTTNASIAFDYINSILYVCTVTGNAATAVWNQPVVTSVPASAIPHGFDSAINLGLNVTHTGGNLLNLAIKQANGSDPTLINPVTVSFQTVSGTNTTGVPTAVNITSALSMTTFATVPFGATFGTSSNTPFRIWFALFNNGGVAVPAMGVFLASTGSLPVAEYGVSPTTSISGSATSAGIWYTPNGTSLTNNAYRLIGYSEYTSGLPTAGTYSIDPSNTVLFGPGVKKPGDVVRRVVTTTATSTIINSATKIATALASSPIVVTSVVNAISVRAKGFIDNSGVNSFVAFQIYRNTGTVGVGSTGYWRGNGTGATGGAIDCEAFDVPSSSNWPPTQYGLYGASTNTNTNQVFLDSASFPGGINGGTPLGIIIVEEIMA